MSFVDRLPTLLGVVAGAAASYLTASLMERSRWQRGMATRWDEHRLVAYVEYAYAVKEAVRLASGLAAGRGMDNQASPIDQQDGAHRLAEAESDRARAYENLVLLGNTETIAAAQVLQRQLWRLEWLASGRLDGDAEVWEQSFSDYKEARAVFYAAARRDLGVSGGPVPRGQWPPSWQSSESTGQ